MSTATLKIYTGGGREGKKTKLHGKKSKEKL
jgi:hypothetical protein